MRAQLLRSLIIVVGSGLVGCGRYIPARPPEKFAPIAVAERTVQCTPAGVVVSWHAPSKNRVGKELTSLTGYQLLTRTVDGQDAFDRETEFTPTAFIPDTHIEHREELRKEARAEGKVGRRVDVPDAEKRFSATLTGVQGKLILRVIPVSAEGFAGDEMPPLLIDCAARVQARELKDVDYLRYAPQ